MKRSHRAILNIHFCIEDLVIVGAMPTTGMEDVYPQLELWAWFTGC